ncbi:MAG: acyl-homoserine-lactone synthase [Alphaproteobacteria bacterium]|nr:acyl-homoserine-lactone synthase [Alphaproteobacteria bacterium]
MMEIVNPEDRDNYTAQLEDMFHQRYKVFVEKFGWDLPDRDDENAVEKDAYDGDDTVYLMTTSEEGDVIASIRLYPSEGPTMMRDLFPHLCENGYPTGPSIWEFSRLYVWAPDLEQHQKTMIGVELLCGLMEYGLMYGIEKVIFQTTMTLIGTATHVGVDIEPLGLPQADGEHEPIVAGAMALTPTGLQNLRRVLGITGSIFRQERTSKAA